ncbi:MAG: hypothetical protein JW940_10250 [Polyangiaceae bacterium]|nr:hypothetical protein [Polyangiaceae bacterium]
MSAALNVHAEPGRTELDRRVTVPAGVPVSYPDFVALAYEQHRDEKPSLRLERGNCQQQVMMRYSSGLDLPFLRSRRPGVRPSASARDAPDSVSDPLAAAWLF